MNSTKQYMNSAKQWTHVRLLFTRKKKKKKKKKEENADVRKRAIQTVPICSKDKNIESYNSFPRFWGKNEIYYSLLLFICHYSLLLFTCYCSLRNFAYLRGVVPYFSSKFLVCLVQDFFPRESYPLRAFLWEISLPTITSLLSQQSL